MATQVASVKNQKVSRETNAAGRSSRIQNEYGNGRISGDYQNSAAMKAANKTLTQQRFGTHAQKAADIRAAFGVTSG